MRRMERRLGSEERCSARNSTHNRPKRFKPDDCQLIYQWIVPKNTNSEEDQMETKLKATTFRTHWLGMARIAKAAITLLAFSLTISTALAQVRNSTITGTI